MRTKTRFKREQVNLDTTNQKKDRSKLDIIRKRKKEKMCG